MILNRSSTDPMVLKDISLVAFVNGIRSISLAMLSRFWCFVHLMMENHSKSGFALFMRLGLAALTLLADREIMRSAAELNALVVHLLCKTKSV